MSMPALLVHHTRPLPFTLNHQLRVALSVSFAQSVRQFALSPGAILNQPLSS